VLSSLNEWSVDGGVVVLELVRHVLEGPGIHPAQPWIEPGAAIMVHNSILAPQKTPQPIDSRMERPSRQPGI
jgi:hypothetical protein